MWGPTPGQGAWAGRSRRRRGQGRGCGVDLAFPVSEVGSWGVLSRGTISDLGSRRMGSGCKLFLHISILGRLGSPKEIELQGFCARLLMALAKSRVLRVNCKHPAGWDGEPLVSAWSAEPGSVGSELSLSSPMNSSQPQAGGCLGLLGVSSSWRPVYRGRWRPIGVVVQPLHRPCPPTALVYREALLGSRRPIRTLASRCSFSATQPASR